MLAYFSVSYFLLCKIVPVPARAGLDFAVDGKGHGEHLAVFLYHFTSFLGVGVGVSSRSSVVEGAVGFCLQLRGFHVNHLPLSCTFYQ